MIYNLRDRLPLQKNTIYALQHVIYIAISAVSMPIVIGPMLGLNQVEVAEMLQRTFLISGIISILQVKCGHGFPIVEAPAGLWTGILTIMAGLVSSIGKDLTTLRTDLEGGLLIAGLIVMLITVMGMIPIVTKLFTPVVNSVLILLMVLQISPSIVKGMLGITKTNQVADFKVAAVFFTIVFIILAVNLFAKGFIQSISTLMGIGTGWILAILLHLTKPIDLTDKPLIFIPRVFAWGTPTFDLGIAITCVLASLILLSMTYTSIKSMSELLKEEVPTKKWNRAFLINGLSTALAGVFPIIAFMPYLSSTGFLAMTRVAARSPFVWAGGAMIILGFFSPVGLLFASIPMSVGCGAMLVIFSLILGQGLRELQKTKITNRESFVIGISLLIGIGAMFLPTTTFQDLPSTLEYILPNGLVDGIIIALILDNILPKEEQ